MITTPIVITATVALTLIIVGGVAWVVLAVRARQAREQPASELSDRIAGIEARMQQGIGELSERTSQMHANLSDLTMVMANDRVRGGWGELTLARTLELSGLQERRDFDLQVSTPHGRPDAIVHLPQGRKLIIDAKFPISRFSEAMQATNSEERDEKLRQHAGDLLSEAKQLNKRGYHSLADGGFIVMYVPSEALYAESLRVKPELFELLKSQNVLLAGPTTLMALLGTAAFLLAEARIVDDARQILLDAKELRSRLQSFATHLAKVGRGLTSATRAYNQAVGSYEARVLPKASDVASHAGAAGLDELPTQEEQARELSTLTVAS